MQEECTEPESEMQEIKLHKSHIQDFAPHTFIDHRVLNLSESHFPFSSSTSTSSSSLSKPFSRRFLHPDGHTRPYVPLLPESPSSICTKPFQISSSDSENFYSDIASQIPSPRKQGFGKICIDNNIASCNYEVEEWLKHANKFCKPNNFMTRHYSSSDCGDSWDQNGSNAGDKLSISSICKKFIDHELYSTKWPSVKESTAYESQSRLACIKSMRGHFKSERDQRQGRPKPYSAYLNEIEMQKVETERDSWKRARHHEMLERMRRKEAAIDDWELEQTMIAVEKMKKVQKKFQNKLETKQLKVAVKTQKKLGLLKQKAEKQKRNLRRTTIQKISTTTNISGTDACSCRGLFTCFKCGSFC